MTATAAWFASNGIASIRKVALIQSFERCRIRPFKVSDLTAALVSHTVLLGPYEPIEGFRVAIIEDGGSAD